MEFAYALDSSPTPPHLTPRMFTVGDTATLVRLVGASVLVGLLAFCIAHVVQVWRKRNARPADRAPAARRLAWACLLAGGVLIPAAAVHRELTRAEGVLTGEGLFVVRAAEDAPVEWLREGDAVAADEPLARFGSRSARAEELRARLARAEAERDVLELLPLTPDPELSRRHQAVVQERTQAQQELGQLIIASEAAGRDQTAQIFAKKETLARLDLTVTERRKELDRATVRSSHANFLLTTMGKLSTGGSVSSTEYQEHLKAARDAEIEVGALTQEVKDLLAQKDVFRGQLDKLEAGRADPADPLRKQVDAFKTRLARLEVQEEVLKPKIDRDLARSSTLREAEKVQIAAKIREHRAGVDGLARELEVRAPFAGRLAYRTASPNATRPHGTLAVLAPQEGFLLTSRITQSDADSMREGGEVLIEVGEGSPERRIPARFLRAAPLAHEPGYAALQLDCQPPPEMVRRLAEGEKLTVAFAWNPPLTALWPFRAGIVLMAAGLIGLLIGRARRIRTEPRRASWTETIERAAPPEIEVRVPVEIRTTEEVEDLPSDYEELEARYRESLADLNRAATPEVAAGLLSRLRRIRRVRKTLIAPVPSDRFLQLREVLKSTSQSDSPKQLSAGRA
jgi:hypothetical protein